MSDTAGSHTRDKLAKIAQSVLAAKSISRPILPNDNLRDIGLTSLDMVSLVLTVEAEFGVQMSESDITPANFRSISSIENLLRRLHSNEALNGASNPQGKSHGARTPTRLN
jgi:acyl carrier protein